MNPIVLPAALLLAITCASAWAAPPAPKTPVAEVPPPPGMHDPTTGSSTKATAPAQEAASAAPAGSAEDPLAPLPKPDARLVRDKASRITAENRQRIAASDVTKRQQGSDTIEEYREHGRIWMIRIIPVNGPIQTFVTNDGSGRLVRDPHEGPVSPVYYSLYEWK